MHCFVNPDPRLARSADLNPVRLIVPEMSPGRERLRHLIIGSPEGVRSTIDTLHVLRYAERLRWSRLFTVPKSGVVITPEQGEVFSYLMRWRPLR